MQARRAIGSACGISRRNSEVGQQSELPGRNGAPLTDGPAGRDQPDNPPLPAIPPVFAGNGGLALEFNPGLPTALLTSSSLAPSIGSLPLWNIKVSHQGEGDNQAKERKKKDLLRKWPSKVPFHLLTALLSFNTYIYLS